MVSLNDGPDDEAFLQSLRRSLKTARGAYPPVALAEIYQEFKSPLTMIRRLHLMVVDLDRSRSVSPQVYQDFMNCRVSLDRGKSSKWARKSLGNPLIPRAFFFCCIAELAVKPCRSSRSKLRGEFGIPNTCKTGNKNTTKQQTPPNPKHTKQKTGKCLECETRGEKRVKRSKRSNALICRTPGGSIRYPLSSSLGDVDIP